MARILPFGFLSPSSVSLVDGSDGDLVVLNGQTVQITAGSIKSYNSIDVQAGGILEITGPEAITQIGCKGNFIVNGTFRGQTTENVAARAIGADNWLGNPYSYTPVQSSGGRGGNNSIDQRAGGSQSNGHGGGGAGESIGNCGAGSGGNGQSNGGNTTTYFNEFSVCVGSAFTAFGGTANQGGHGSPGNYSNTVSTQSAAFSLAYGGNGGGGGGGAGSVFNFVLKATNTWDNGASGAGGGARGVHGRSVFILAESGITGSGSINFSGGAGYNGGGVTGSSNLASGGGGGGAGGTGGSLWIKSAGGVVIPTTTIAGGAGGARSPITGQPGYATSSSTHTNGSAGSAGILDVQAS